VDARAGAEAGVVPFSSDRKLMAVFRRTGERRLIAYVKGAPSRVLELCALDAPARDARLAENNALAADGLRVLGVASGDVAAPDERALAGLTFEGFIGLADPPAPGVKETIARLHGAGLRTVMLTGDQRLTAEAVGRQLGVDAVFSRVTPEDKLRIVEAEQARGGIVAMLGDGINDAPALRKADVGVAMGMRGTDVAREAAAIVLRDDRFETIAAAVEEGRVIFDNIRKFVFYLFSCNTAEVLVLLGAAVAGLPPPLVPLQLLWLNMITDTFPALALAMEPAEEDVMRRGPRSPDEALLSRTFLREVLLYAALMTLATLAAFVWARAAAPERATTIAFMTLALTQIAHLGNARSSRAVVGRRGMLANRYALAAVAVAAALQAATVVVAPLAALLGVTPLRAAEWLVIAGLAAVPALIGQALKGRHDRRR
jgi:Ca2+-transporting ATPase